jgi:hypothetical protein
VIGKVPTAARGALNVAGVSGGVGTSVVAAATGGIDQGVFVGRPVDVLVCRGSVESAIRAARAARLLGANHAWAVLAVTAIDPSGPSRVLRARLRLIEPHIAGVVVLPWVPQWRDAVTPLEAVREARNRAPDELPRPVRAYVRAVAAIHTALRSAPRTALPASVTPTRSARRETAR